MQDAYALNRKGLKGGSVYSLNRGYALNNGVRLTTTVYGICFMGKQFLVLMRLCFITSSSLVTAHFGPEIGPL